MEKNDNILVSLLYRRNKVTNYQLSDKIILVKIKGGLNRNLRHNTTIAESVQIQQLIKRFN